MKSKTNTPEGYLYYIRLKTEKCTFYKIGYTKKKSVKERFSCGGSLNYKLIDKILVFKPHVVNGLLI